MSLPDDLQELVRNLETQRAVHLGASGAHRIDGRGLRADLERFRALRIDSVITFLYAKSWDNETLAEVASAGIWLHTKHIEETTRALEERP